MALGVADDGRDLDQTCYFAIEQAPGYATSDAPITVPQRGEIQIVLSYKALDLNPVEPQELIIESNDRSNSRVTVRLSVRTGEPQLNISKDAVAFPAGVPEATESLYSETQAHQNYPFQA